jgi:hypothetical protein
LRGWIVDRPAKGLITAYGISLGTVIMIEWGLARFAPSRYLILSKGRFSIQSIFSFAPTAFVGLIQKWREW